MSRLLSAIVCACVVGAPWTASIAHAQDRTEIPTLDLRSVRVMAVDDVLRGELDQRSFPVRPAPRERVSPALRSLYATTAVMQDPLWRRFFVEAYLFVAAVYFIFCFALSKYSQKVEQWLNEGRRF